MQTLPTWNLQDLYRDLDDPQINKDLLELQRRVRDFDAKFRGKITNQTSPKKILLAIRKYEVIARDADKILIFAELANSTQSDQPQYGAFLQKQLAANIEIANRLLFFDLALSELSQQKLQSLVQEPLLENYQHFLQRQIAWKPHRLSEAEEKIVNEKKATGVLAFARLFEQQHANQEYTFEFAGKLEQLNQAQILAKLQNSDRSIRQAAAQTLAKGLRAKLEVSAFVYNMIVQDKLVNDKYFKFKKPEDSRHKTNEIDGAAVDALVAAVVNSYGLVQDFYQHKQQLLGYRELYDYDRYAPLEKIKEKISYEDAKKIVLESFEEFSPKLKVLAEEFFVNNWIDAQPRKGKRGGAFCQYVSPDVHPFILINYQGDISDVSTLAHELGHGVHACLAKKQTYLNFSWPLTLAETASVFAEMLAFEVLKTRVRNPEEKVALYAATLERIFSSVHRQTSMFQFERAVFAHVAKKGELSEDDFNRLWQEKQKEMFGTAVELTEEYASWWSYVPHFINTPFYVYAYAFGELLSLALFAKYKENNDAFVEKYLNILAAGGSQNPRELFLPLGIDLASREFWEKGIEIVREMVEEFKQL